MKKNVILQLKGDVASKQLLCIKLSNLVHKYENSDKFRTLRLLSSFTRSHMASKWLQKGRAVRSIFQWLQCYEKNMVKNHFN